MGNIFRLADARASSRRLLRRRPLPSGDIFGGEKGAYRNGCCLLRLGGFSHFFISAREKFRYAEILYLHRNSCGLFRLVFHRREAYYVRCKAPSAAFEHRKKSDNKTGAQNSWEGARVFRQKKQEI